MVEGQDLNPDPLLVQSHFTLFLKIGVKKKKKKKERNKRKEIYTHKYSHNHE